MMKRFLSFTFPVEIKFTNEQLLVRRFKAINYSENILKIWIFRMWCSALKTVQWPKDFSAELESFQRSI